MAFCRRLVVGDSARHLVSPVLDPQLYQPNSCSTNGHLFPYIRLVCLHSPPSAADMITSTLRRAARSCSSAHSIPPRPSTPSAIAASLSCHSHQRRQSSSKPPVPPNDGSANITAPAVKTVGTPRSKEAGEKRPGAESRLSKRKLARDKAEKALDAKDEWATNLPSVPSTQHLDPRGKQLPSNVVDNC